MNYQTKQRQQVLAIVKEQRGDFTAKDLYDSSAGAIGLTTIYRSLEALAKEGVILRVSSDQHAARYQYLAPCARSDHFYLKCEKCGQTEHVDCQRIQGLAAHISEKHQFIPTNTSIVINGFCAKCFQKDSRKEPHGQKT